MPRYVLKYLPGRLYKHLVPDTWKAYRRSLCGLAPDANHPSHDLWTADPEELARRPVCHTCTVVLTQQPVAATPLAAAVSTQAAQEDGLV